MLKNIVRADVLRYRASGSGLEIWDDFLARHDFQFVDCANAPAVELHVLDRLPDDSSLSIVRNRIEQMPALPDNAALSDMIEALIKLGSHITKEYESLIHDIESRLPQEDAARTELREKIRRSWFVESEPPTERSHVIIHLSLVRGCNIGMILKVIRRMTVVLSQIEDLSDQEMSKLRTMVNAQIERLS